MNPSVIVKMAPMHDDLVLRCVFVWFFRLSCSQEAWSGYCDCTFNYEHFVFCWAYCYSIHTVKCRPVHATRVLSLSLFIFLSLVCFAVKKKEKQNKKTKTKKERARFLKLENNHLSEEQKSKTNKKELRKKISTHTIKVPDKVTQDKTELLTAVEDLNSVWPSFTCFSGNFQADHMTYIYIYIYVTKCIVCLTCFPHPWT